MARMKFMNTEIDNLTMQETLQVIDQLIQENKSASLMRSWVLLRLFIRLLPQVLEIV